MNTLGIIVEYNPFHNGHLFHIQRSKEITGADAVVAVMSGNFVQRGIPAIIDKWVRTEMALLNGVDLVLELPVLYSLSSAEIFAFGAMSILNSIGIVDNICFASECGNIHVLKKIARILETEPESFQSSLKNYLAFGISFPNARCKALADYIENKYGTCSFDPNVIMTAPNNTLGIEYCKSIFKLNSGIKPFTILREGSGYNTEVLEDGFSSATAIRKYFKENKPIKSINKYVPDNIMNIFWKLDANDYDFVFSDDILPFIKYKLLTLSNKDEIRKIPDISEGIENRIYKAIECAQSFDEMVDEIKSKRYTHTRICRILCQLFVGFEWYNTLALRKKSCPYARVLGFNNKGAALLKDMKSKSSIPFYVKIPKEPDDIMKLDIQATRAYSLINRNVKPDCDYTKHPIII